MLFDKNLFESKYVPAEQRTPVDTLILIGNGFDKELVSNNVISKFI